MKRIFVTTLVLAVATLTIHAQEVPGKIEGRSRMHDRDEFHHIQLTQEQKDRFKTLNTEFRQQMQELRKKDDITVKEWRTQMENLRKEHHEKMQNVLTNDQKAQLKKDRDDRQKMRQIDRDARLQKTKVRLGLTDDQVARMKQNRTDMEGKAKALRENKSLTHEQRREQFKQLRDKQQADLKSILTDEQWKKLHEKQGHRRQKQLV